MGHRVFDELPATAPWQRVVGLLGPGLGFSGKENLAPGSLQAVAQATLEAAEKGLVRCAKDDGVCYTFFLLTQVTQAARQEDFQAALVDVGLPGRLGIFQETVAIEEFGLFDLTAGFTSAVDRHLRVTDSRTDLGEMAQDAAAESLTFLCRARAETLFGTSSGTVQDALQKLSTKKGFARLAKDFFGRFARRFLLYHLSRELSNHVGTGRRFANSAAHNAFLGDLSDFCHVRAGILERFAAEWYSKHNWQGGITLLKTRHFMPHAMDKLRVALGRGSGDAE